MTKEVVRYFLLKSVKGPDDQIGVALKSTSRFSLEDLTGFFSFVRKRVMADSQDYEADTNVDLYGKSRGEEDSIGLRVFSDARIEIYKQLGDPMGILEIDKALAEKKSIDIEMARANEVTRTRIRVVAPGNPELGIPPYVGYC